MSYFSIPAWFQFLQIDLQHILQNLPYNNVILTGSAAIAYVVKKLGMGEELNQMVPPNDIDFLYISKFAVTNPDNICEYTLNDRQKDESSVTFSNITDSRFFNRFDISKETKCKFFSIDGINIINLYSLKLIYQPGFETPEDRIEKDLVKCQIIQRIIDKIKETGQCEEYGLESDSQKKRSFLDDELDDIPYFKLPDAKCRKNIPCRGSLFDDCADRNTGLFGNQDDCDGSLFDDC